MSSMSDFIDKRSLLVYLRNWQYEQFAGIGNEKEYNLLEKLIHGIENEPTISEQKIRDKAIEEFAGKLHELCGYEEDDYQYPYLLHESRIDEIAEQMREVGE